MTKIQNTNNLKMGDPLIIVNNFYGMHHFKKNEVVYVKDVISSYIMVVENEHGTSYKVHVANVNKKEKGENKMENLIGKKVKINEGLYNADNISAYTQGGYMIGHVYEVIDSKYSHGTVVQLKNHTEGKRPLWIKLSYVDVIESEAEATLIQTSAMLKERRDAIYSEIKRLQSEAQLIEDTLGYLKEFQKGIK